jgi:hypothetical protein
MPGASRAPAASRANERKHASVVTAGPPKTSGIPRAAGFNGLLHALPGDRALCHRHPRDHRLAGLISASRYQDHVASPSTIKARSSFAPSRPPHPLAQRFVTIAKRPSFSGRDARKNAGDLPDATSENACDRLARRANQVRPRKGVKAPVVIASVSEAIQRYTNEDWIASSL